MQQAPGRLAPVLYSVVVPLTPERAQVAWLGELGAWWPLDTHGVFGAGASVGLEGSALVERSPGGEASVWGTLMDHAAGRWVELTWHPGQAAEAATRLSVRFAPARLATAQGVVEATEVRLEHSGWGRRDDGAAARENYARDWPGVMDLYAVHAAQT